MTALVSVLAVPGAASAAAIVCHPDYTGPTAALSLSTHSPGYGNPMGFDGSASSPGSETTYTPNYTTRNCDESGTYSDPIGSYVWNFGDNTSATTESGIHSYATPGSYTVTLTVKTSRGQKSDSTTTQVTVGGPQAAFASPTTSEWNKSFDAHGSTDPQGLTGYAWDFGDGHTGTGVTTGHTYDHAGTFTVSLKITDVGGFTDTTTHSVTASPDSSVPSIAITKPLQDDVYLEGQPVAAGYGCSNPGGSGFAPNAAGACSGPVAPGALIDTSSAGDKTFTVTSTNNAGRQATATITYHVVATAPVLSITSPSQGGTYGRGVLVPANYTCVEVYQAATCTGSSNGGPAVPNGQPIDTSTLGAHTFTVVGRDPHGHQTIKTVGYQVVDVTPPAIDIHTPSDSAVFIRGQVIHAVFSCADEAGGSGLASCAGERPSGAAIDTATPGNKTFTVVARDAAGNQQTATVRYAVLDYPALASSATLKYLNEAGGAVKIVRLIAVRVPAGARIAVSCHGRGCGRLTKPIVVRRKSSLVALRQWPGRVLGPGTTLTITVTKPFSTGVVSRYRVGAGHNVAKTDLCLPPNGTPRAC